MTILGIDPGIEKVGIGIVKKQNQEYKLIHHELIKTSARKPHAERLQLIYERITAVVNKFTIDAASIEKLFFAKNVKTAMVVSEARGVILLALKLLDLPIYEYTPLQVKQGLIGYGRASKNQIRDFIKLMLKLKEVPSTDDVTDGIALAIIHLNTFKTLSKIKKGF